MFNSSKSKHFISEILTKYSFLYRLSLKPHLLYCMYSLFNINYVSNKSWAKIALSSAKFKVNERASLMGMFIS